MHCSPKGPKHGPSKTPESTGRSSSTSLSLPKRSGPAQYSLRPRTTRYSKFSSIAVATHLPSGTRTLFQNGQRHRHLRRCTHVFYSGCPLEVLTTKIEEQDRYNITFIFHHGLQWFKQIPLDQIDGQSTFRQGMDVIVSQVKLQFDLVYLRDAVVLWQIPSTHINHVRAVLTLIDHALVSLKLPYCSIFWNQIYYLGHMI